MRVAAEGYFVSAEFSVASKNVDVGDGEMTPCEIGTFLSSAIRFAVNFQSFFFFDYCSENIVENFGKFIVIHVGFLIRGVSLYIADMADDVVIVRGVQTFPYGL